jgi:hypothetical protein
LKLKCDELLSSFDFNFNLRRYNQSAQRHNSAMSARLAQRKVGR